MKKHINFVVLGNEYREFPRDPDKDWSFFTRTNMIWSYLTYLRLNEIGYPNIGFSNKIVCGSINVGTSAILSSSKIENSKNCKETIFIVIRADKLYSLSSNISVVQSPEHSLKYKNSFFITHWPQPGMIPRKRDDHVVKKIGMAGIPKHYAISQYQDRFQKDMEEREIEIVNLDRSRWNDYSDIDIVLAVREFNKKPLIHKPASKLINGWTARVPVICNPESTYRWVGENGQDYIEVESYDQVINAIDKLRMDEKLYYKIIKKGNGKAKSYTNEKVCVEWMRLLDGIRKNSINSKSVKNITLKKIGFKYEEMVHRMLKIFD